MVFMAASTPSSAPNQAGPGTPPPSSGASPAGGPPTAPSPTGPNPAGNPGVAPPGIPQPAMAAIAPGQGMPTGPMDPMIPPHVRAMMPRPYPNPQQMFRPVGLSAVMQMQMMQQQAGGPSGKPPKK